MAAIEKQIQTKLNSAFRPSFLDVENESHKHNVPPGSESHFRVTVVSDEFNGMSLVKRHQKINEVLRDEMEGPIHALSIRAKTPHQWKDNAGLIQPTPKCEGGE
jgi:BolA family transcriptional regulator, general stress-responsive regulator